MEKKYKRGDIREDGMVFRNYNCRGEEWWITPEAFAEFRGADKRRSQAYRERNPDRVKQANKNWNLKNPGRNAEIAKEWRKNNKEKCLAGVKDWKRRNPDKVKEIVRRQIERNKEKWLAQKRAARSKRRAILESRTHPMHDKRIELVLIQSAQRLTKCFGVKFEVDHIKPIALGGYHYHLNMSVIPHVWNRRKHIKDASILPDCWINK